MQRCDITKLIQSRLYNVTSNFIIPVVLVSKKMNNFHSKTCKLMNKT